MVRGRERGSHAAMDQRQESNPGRCGQDWALMVRALPSEPMGRPLRSIFLYQSLGGSKKQRTDDMFIIFNSLNT